MSFPENPQKLKIVEDIDRPEFTLTPNTEWRKVDQEWNAASEAKAHDYVFQLVLTCGASAKLIAQRFGLDIKTVEATFGETIRKAQAQLAMLLFADQITAALTTSSIQAKQWAGKQFAGQLEQPTISTTDSDGHAVEFEVKLVKIENKKDKDVEA